MSAAKTTTGGSMTSGLMSDMFHIPVLSERKNKPDLAVGKSGYASTRFWNYPLISKRKEEPDAAKGKAGHVSTQFFNYALVSPDQKRDSAVGKSGTVSHQFWKQPLISKRKEEPTHAVGKSRTITL